MLEDVQVIDMLKDELNGAPQAKLAAKIGVTQSYLSELLSGYKKPNDRILRFLGLKRVEGYVVKGKVK